MGQQSNKIIKRRRRKAYLERKKARGKAGIGRLPSSRSKGSAADGDVKPAAKKAAKKAAVKKVAKKKDEVAVVASVEALDTVTVAETAPAAES